MATKFKRKQNLIWSGGICLVVLALSVLLVCLLVQAPNSLGKKDPEKKKDVALTEKEENRDDKAPATVPPLENPLKPEDFVYEDDYLICMNTTSRRGIDVSYVQGDVDWEQVAQAGMEFAIIRVGYRGTTAGGLNQDSYAEANYRGATDAGLKVGCYFFSQATTPREAEEEAEYVLDIIADWQLEMPVVYDWEYGGPDSRTANMDARTLTDCTLAFCRVIEEAGYEPMIYFNEDQSHKQMNLGELTQYRFWLAQYGEMLDYPYRVDMWQYTQSGKVPGIDEYVDINLLFEYQDEEMEN